jgi:hypothetical protein
MSRDTLLPDELLAVVVTTLYDAADHAGWESLPVRDRTSRYSAWVEDERVGGILTRFMTPESARTWIKDGPMKEYGRARRGVGRYARFGRTSRTGPNAIAVAALGKGATVVDGTVGVKPLHFHAVDANGTASYIAWGESHTFKNLLWAALRAAVDHGMPAHIVVTEPPGHVTPSELVKSQQAVADRCGLELHHTREEFGERTTGASA